MTTTNFPNGVTNVGPDGPLGNFLSTDPSKMHQFFNDFDIYLATDWTVTETQAGATQAIVAGDGGLLALVNSAGNNDVNAIKLVNNTFAPSLTLPFWFKTRLKVSDIVASAVQFGLLDTNVNLAPADGIYITKSVGVATANLIVRTGGVSTTSAGEFNTGVSDTFYDLAITWDPNTGAVVGWANGSPFASITTLTNFPAGVNVAPGVGLRNGEAVAKTLTVDYLMAAQER